MIISDGYILNCLQIGPSKNIIIEANGLEIILQAETTFNAKEWRERIKDNINASLSLKHLKTLEWKYYKEPHLSLLHFISILNTLDLLVYGDSQEYLGVIFVTCEEDGITLEKTISKQIIYYSEE